MLFTIKDFGWVCELFENLKFIVHTSKQMNHLLIYVDSNLHYNTSFKAEYDLDFLPPGKIGGV